MGCDTKKNESKESREKRSEMPYKGTLIFGLKNTAQMLLSSPSYSFVSF